MRRRGYSFGTKHRGDQVGAPRAFEDFWEAYFQVCGKNVLFWGVAEHQRAMLKAVRTVGGESEVPETGSGRTSALPSSVRPLLGHLLGRIGLGRVEFSKEEICRKGEIWAIIWRLGITLAGVPWEGILN